MTKERAQAERGASSWNSYWVRQEAFYTLMKGNLVPMMTKERETSLELPFSAVQTYRNNAAGYAELVAAIRAK